MLYLFLGRLLLDYVAVVSALSVDHRKISNIFVAGIQDGEHSNIRINANSVSQCPLSSTHFGA